MQTANAFYHWKAMNHLEFQPLWRIVSREGDSCVIEGRDSKVRYLADFQELVEVTEPDSKPYQLFLF